MLCGAAGGCDYDADCFVLRGLAGMAWRSNRWLERSITATEGIWLHWERLVHIIRTTMVRWPTSSHSQKGVGLLVLGFIVAHFRGFHSPDLIESVGQI